ncbi:MAG: ABC transporter substrate-binding protein [Alphaproteobacteria bacterium]|nr:ABC transporter substrate-binding protein [Alphaproteobacteria bacterium]
MKRSTLKKVLAAAAFAVGFGLAAASGDAAAQAVKIAGNIPLTGPVAAFSGGFFKGFELGLEDACKDLQVDCKQFKLDGQDNAEKPEQALSVIQKQLLDNPAVVISGTSPSSNAISPTVDARGIPHFVVAFDAFITQKGKDRFRILPNFKIAPAAYFKYLDLKKPKKVFNLALNVSSIQDEFKLIIEPELKKRGIEFQTEIFDFGNKDYSTLALKAKQYNPDLVIVEGFSFHVYPALKALRTYGLVDKPGRVIAALDMVDLIYNKTPRDELKGIAFLIPDFELPGKNAKAPEWRARFKAKYNSDPTYVEAYAYDTARVIVAAYKKAGKVTTESILSVMPFAGLVGKIELDQDRDIKGSVSIAIFNDKGEVEEVKTGM